MTQIIDGKALAASIRADLAKRTTVLTEKGHRPGLAVVIVGDDPASQVYVRNKIRACADTGIESIEYRLAKDTREEELLKLIGELNNDKRVDGILVQLPLPEQIAPEKVIAAIAPEKDVDGFHVMNAGKLLTGTGGFMPCTPYGVMKLLEEAGCDPAGKHAVVIGRSNIVGKPMALLLLQKNCTVTIAHSHTKDLTAVTRSADILVVAVGRAGFITGDMIKPGAAVMDVGINRVDGKVVGDVDFESAKEVASCITPVPGGVGSVTTAVLALHGAQAAENNT